MGQAVFELVVVVVPVVLVVVYRHWNVTLTSATPFTVSGPVTVAVMVSAWVTTTTPPSESDNVTVMTLAPLPPPQPHSHNSELASNPASSNFSQHFTFVSTISPNVARHRRFKPHPNPKANLRGGCGPLIISRFTFTARADYIQRNPGDTAWRIGRRAHPITVKTSG